MAPTNYERDTKYHKRQLFNLAVTLILNTSFNEQYRLAVPITVIPLLVAIFNRKIHTVPIGFYAVMEWKDEINSDAVNIRANNITCTCISD